MELLVLLSGGEGRTLVQSKDPLPPGMTEACGRCLNIKLAGAFVGVKSKAGFLSFYFSSCFIACHSGAVIKDEKPETNSGSSLPPTLEFIQFRHKHSVVYSNSQSRLVRGNIRGGGGHQGNKDRHESS